MSTLTDTSPSAKETSPLAGAATLSHQAGTRAHNAVGYLSEGAHRVVDSLESTAANIEPKGRRVLESAQSYVRTNPLLSLGIALAAGMVVRHLVRR